jgi:PAS domain S-box-containing protein
MSEPVRALLVEDSELDAVLAVRELRKADLEPDATRVATAPALEEALREDAWDVVLADFELPGFDGFTALSMVRAADREVPCVVVSGRIGEEMAVEAMRAGAQDFVPKDKLARLGPVVRRALAEARMERARAQDRKRIAVQQEVAALLVGEGSIGDAMSAVLRAVVRTLGWSVAVLWRWDVERRVLCHGASAAMEPREEVERELRRSTFAPGVGLPGQVIDDGEARWIQSLGEEPQRPRPLAVHEGLRAAMAVLVVVDREPYGVLEVLAARALEEDRELVATMEGVAGQLGLALGRERALAALRESEARKAAVLEAALDAVITMDHRGRILEFNPAAERMFGFSREEVLGREMAALIMPPSLRDAHRRGMARYLATGESSLMSRRLELQALRKDGREFPAEITFGRVDRNGPPVFTGFVRDVTESVELFRALQNAEARHRILAEIGAALVESLELSAVLPRVASLLSTELCDWCAIHLIDDRGRLQQVAAAHRLPARAARIEQLWRRRPPSPECEVGPARVARTGTPQLVSEVSAADVRRIARDPEEASLLTELGVGSFLAVPLTARGHVVGALSLVLEPGRRRLGPEELALATELARRCATAIENARLHREVQASLRARDDFLALAAHELATPITPLRIQAQQLARVVEEAPGRMVRVDQLAGPVRGVERSSRRLAELVERLLDVSRVTVGRMTLEPSSFDLVALAREVAREMEDALRRAGSAIEWRVPDEPVVGSWDRRRVAIAIRNLLSNAIKFGRGQPIEVTIEADDTQIALSVRDHGLGLSPAERSRLFERFARASSLRHYGGFGLGLWIVRQVAEEHGGAVSVSSEPGEGACFGFTLPRPGAVPVVHARPA